MILGFANGEAAEGYFTVCNINKTGEFSMFIILGRLDAVYKETGQKLSKYQLKMLWAADNISIKINFKWGILKLFCWSQSHQDRKGAKLFKIF